MNSTLYIYYSIKNNVTNILTPQYKKTFDTITMSMSVLFNSKFNLNSKHSNQSITVFIVVKLLRPSSPGVGRGEDRIRSATGGRRSLLVRTARTAILRTLLVDERLFEQE